MTRRILVSLGLVSVGLLALVACAPAMDAGRMQPMPDILAQIEPNAVLRQNVSLGAVEVNEEARDNHIARVTPDVFRRTLHAALFNGDLIPHGDRTGQYRLDAKLVEFEVPLGFFSYDAPCAVHYTLIRAADGKTIWQDTIRQEGHAGFAEMMTQPQPVMDAMAIAVRENVTHLLRVLAQLNFSAPRPANAPAIVRDDAAMISDTWSGTH